MRRCTCTLTTTALVYWFSGVYKNQIHGGDFSLYIYMSTYLVAHVLGSRPMMLVSGTFVAWTEYQAILPTSIVEFVSLRLRNLQIMVVEYILRSWL